MNWYLHRVLLTKDIIITWGPGQVPVCPWRGLTRGGGGGGPGDASQALALAGGGGGGGASP